VQDADHGFGGLLARNPLDGVNHDCASTVGALGTGLGFDRTHQGSSITSRASFDGAQQLDLGLFRGESGHALESGDLLDRVRVPRDLEFNAELFERCLLRVEVGLPLGQGVH
jgi:hypothetical protein